MAVAVKYSEPNLDELTYEDYMSEGEVNKRYDIIDGVRIFMTNPSVEHQTIQFNIATMLRDYQRKTRAGRMIAAPCDVLIRRAPLRTRQPDVLFITHERFGDRALSDPSPLKLAPELVVEILSPSDKRHVMNAKINDYVAVGVRECWIISPQAESVEVLLLAPSNIQTIGHYTMGQVFTSSVFPDLTIEVAHIFEADE